MKVYVCYEVDDIETRIIHVFFYREDADRWVNEKYRSYDREYKEMKIE